MFDQSRLNSAERKPFKTSEALFKELQPQALSLVAVQYGGGSALRAGSDSFSKTGSDSSPKTVSDNSLKTQAKSGDYRSDRIDTGTIADDRFESVVILKTPRGIGTGFYVTPDLILTAFHVVDQAGLVEITFYDGSKSTGRVINHDVRLDLALIKAQTVGRPVRIYSGAIRLGETAEAIGHPKGYDFTITRGVVSAVRKQVSQTLKSGPVVEFIQTDTPISPGNSGGPLFIRDAVIGVNDWARVDKASQSLNFSVSYNEIKTYLDRYEEKSR